MAPDERDAKRNPGLKVLHYRIRLGKGALKKKRYPYVSLRYIAGGTGVATVWENAVGGHHHQ
jgi:hypothetical protein